MYIIYCTYMHAAIITIIQNYNKYDLFAQITCNMMYVYV